MSQLQTLIRTGLAIATAVLVVAGSASLSYALGDCVYGCSPTTPCPCAADGVCRPKRDSWGHYKTKWRPWPGDPSRQAPDLAAPGDASDPDLAPLPDYETPPATEEDLRIPRKKKTKKEDEPAEPMEIPIELPGQLMPGPGVAPEGDAMPDLDPFSRLPNVPEMEDAPPALPASLQQAAVSMGMPRLTLQPLPGQAKTTQVMQASAELPVQRANWQSDELSQQASPAAATVEPANASLQPAVYYEASDLDTSNIETNDITE